MNKITFSQACQGYELHARARHLSEHTLADYRNTYKKFLNHLAADPPMREIDHHQVEAFLAEQEVSNKTILNYHIGLSALWSWALAEGLAAQNVVHLVPRPKPQRPVIVPLAEADARALLAAISFSQVYARPGKATSRHGLPDADRNRAIVLLMLDTGLRASEVCNLQILHADLRGKNKSVRVHAGKGNKDRQIPISPRTGAALWKYLASRRDSRVDEPLFATKTGRRMDRNDLGNMLEAAARRAGVPGVNPHRIRHTFAINYLRNGGDIYTLQVILGHSTLDMVKTYLMIAQADTEAAHRRASPVDHWNL